MFDNAADVSLAGSNIRNKRIWLHLIQTVPSIEL
jgi:hypothetical protein